MSSASPRDPVRALSNRIFLRISGRRFRAYSIVRHTGARTGQQYTNPVSAYPLADGFVIPAVPAFPWWQRRMLAARGIQDYLFARQA